jgi:hypothetical protein
VVDGSARRNHDHEAAWREYQTALEAWQAERESVRSQAFDAEWKASVRAGLNNGPSTDRAHAAARTAVAEFEKSSREPVFSEPESRVQSWLRRVTAGAR